MLKFHHKISQIAYFFTEIALNSTQIWYTIYIDHRENGSSKDCDEDEDDDLQEVGDDAVGGAALHEVSLRRQELLGVELTELLEEVVKQGHLAVLLYLKLGYLGLKV